MEDETIQTGPVAQELTTSAPTETVGDYNPSQKDDNSIPWETPNVGTAEEEAIRRIKIYSPNIYIVQCVDVKLTLSKTPNQYTGDFDKQYTWLFKVVKTIDGSPITYTTGEPVEKNLFPEWTPMNATGTDKQGKPQKTRAIMTALLGLPSHVAYGSPMPKDLIGKFARVTCEAGKGPQSGKPKNFWSAWAPFKTA